MIKKYVRNLFQFFLVIGIYLHLKNRKKFSTLNIIYLDKNVPYVRRKYIKFQLFTVTKYRMHSFEFIKVMCILYVRTYARLF